MKPEYEKIQGTSHQSYTLRRVERESRKKLSQAWHYHPEIEICYTSKSSGRRFVGNQISDYVEGDLVMFGSNLPHGFVTDQFSRQFVVQMKSDFLGRTFLASPELREVRKLFTRAQRGLIILGSSKEASITLIREIFQKTGLDQLLAILTLLNTLAKSDELVPICSELYSLNYSTAEFNRLKIVYDHIMMNYQKTNSVEEIANKLNLSEAGFYKFIKKQSQKTYTELINEFRINSACRLLIQSEKSTAQIAFECGFNNQSYFNRKFKKMMEVTPKEFKRAYRNHGNVKL